MNLKFYISVANGVKKKSVRKFWELVRTFVEVTGEKTDENGDGAGGVCLHPPPALHPE